MDCPVFRTKFCHEPRGGSCAPCLQDCLRMAYRTADRGDGFESEVWAKLQRALANLSYL